MTESALRISLPEASTSQPSHRVRLPPFLPLSTSPSPTPSAPSPSLFTSSQLHLQQRLQMASTENVRLLSRQDSIISDSNRRIQMHIAEIRMLKNEKKGLAEKNKRLMDEVERLQKENNKLRRFSHHSHCFAAHTQRLMRRELRAYCSKLREVYNRMKEVTEEKEELKQLCLYLDDQRQNALGIGKSTKGNESDDQGCGSSERSEEEATTFHSSSFLAKRKDLLCELRCSRSSQPLPEEAEEISVIDECRLLPYIHSIESRVRHLELGQNNRHPSSSCPPSDIEDGTVIEKENEMISERGRIGPAPFLQCPSPTATVSSTGTTFYSSSEDGDDSVLVLGDEISDIFANLEVRSLGRIEEEKTGTPSPSNDIALSAQLPPAIQPISSLTLQMTRRPFVVSPAVIPPSLPSSTMNGDSTLTAAVNALRRREKVKMANGSLAPISLFSTAI